MIRYWMVFLAVFLLTPDLAGSFERQPVVIRSVDAPSLADNLVGEPAQRRVSIYLPPGYESEPHRSYATLYILHGIMDSDETWTRPWGAQHSGFATIQDLMDQGLAAGLLQPMIVVIPDANKTGHYTNSPVTGRWEDFVRQDLVAFIDREYRTLANHHSRGIAGHSMGGHGAIKLGLKYPDTFSVVYALNPSLLDWAGDVSIDNPAFAGLGNVTSMEDMGAANFYIQAIIGVGQAFSPNPDNPPFLTDLPFRVDGEKVLPSPNAYAKWQQQMPVHWIANKLVDPGQLRGLRFDSAFVDEFSHIPIASKRFSETLTEHGFEHQFEMYNGDHRNRLWGREGRLFTELLPYFSRLLHHQ